MSGEGGRQSLIWRLVVATIIGATGALVLTFARGNEPVLTLNLEVEERLVPSGPQGQAALAALGDGPSGGRAVAHRAGGRADADAQAGAPEARQISTKRTAAEPTMGFAPDGTLYFDGLDRTFPGGPIRSAVLRSRDEGRTFQELDLNIPGVSNDTPTADPFIHVDERTGRLFNADLTLPCSRVAYSDDRGDSFRYGQICEQTDHQTLFTGPPPADGVKPTGYPNVVYYCAIDGGASVASSFTGCSKSLDGGGTFRRTGAIPYPPDPARTGGAFGIEGACTGTTGHGFVDAAGTVYLPRGFCDQPYLAISKDEGDTWTRAQVSDLGVMVGAQSEALGRRGGLGLEEHEARVSVDREGTVYYLWVARDHLPYLALSRDGGRTFGRPLMVAAPGVDEVWGPSLDVGDPGRVAFSYIGTTNSPGGPFCVRTTADSCEAADGQPQRGPDEYAKTTWNGYVGMSADARSGDPVFYTGTVNDPGDPLVRGDCGPIQCQMQLDFLTAAIGPEGTPWAAFVDGCPANADEACTTPGVGVLGRLVGGPPLIGTVAGQLPSAQLPPPSAQRSCRSRRSFRIRLVEPRRGRIESARVFVNGKRVRLIRGRRLRAPVDLRGLPKGRYTVRVVAVTTTGRRLVRTRTYRTCVAKDRRR